MTDTHEDDRAAATHHLTAPAATSLDGALGPDAFAEWTDHVLAHVRLEDTDGDKKAEPETVVVPILQYGDGPNDYIATDVDAGQVVVRDGNDESGRAWKYPLRSFLRFVAAAQGLELEGDDEDEAKGDGMYQAAIKQQQRTNKLRAAEQEASADATRDGRSTTATNVRTAADAKVKADASNTERTGGTGRTGR